jgi:hypothetical protein
MAEFMENGCVDFVTENLIRFRLLPEIFQEQNDLRRRGHRVLLGKLRADEQAQRQRNAIGLQRAIRPALEGDGNFSPFAQRRGQGGQLSSTSAKASASSFSNRMSCIEGE